MPMYTKLHFKDFERLGNAGWNWERFTSLYKGLEGYGVIHVFVYAFVLKTPQIRCTPQ